MPGSVTVWYMTEEERLAYIAKHPIVPTEKPKGVAFSDIHSYGERAKKENKSPRIIDGVDVNKLHKLFVKGEKMKDIANALNIKEHILSKYISQQRKVEPDKWPFRTMMK